MLWAGVPACWRTVPLRPAGALWVPRVSTIQSPHSQSAGMRSAGAGLQRWESPWKDMVLGASFCRRTGHTRPTQREGGRRGAHSLSEHTPRGRADQGFRSRTP